MNSLSNRLSFLARLIAIGLVAAVAIEQARAQAPAIAAPQAIEFFERHVPATGRALPGLPWRKAERRAAA